MSAQTAPTTSQPDQAPQEKTPAGAALHEISQLPSDQKETILPLLKTWWDEYHTAASIPEILKMIDLFSPFDSDPHSKSYRVIFLGGLAFHRLGELYIQSEAWERYRGLHSLFRALHYFQDLEERIAPEGKIKLFGNIMTIAHVKLLIQASHTAITPPFIALQQEESLVHGAYTPEEIKGLDTILSHGRWATDIEALIPIAYQRLTHMLKRLQQTPGEALLSMEQKLYGILAANLQLQASKNLRSDVINSASIAAAEAQLAEASEMRSHVIENESLSEVALRQKQCFMTIQHELLKTLSKIQIVQSQQTAVQVGFNAAIPLVLRAIKTVQNANTIFLGKIADPDEKAFVEKGLSFNLTGTTTENSLSKAVEACVRAILLFTKLSPEAQERQKGSVLPALRQVLETQYPQLVSDFQQNKEGSEKPLEEACEKLVRQRLPSQNAASAFALFASIFVPRRNEGPAEDGAHAPS